MLRKTQRLRAALPGLVRQWHRLTRNGRGFSTGEVQSRSGSSLAGVVGGFAVGAITAGATAYYFLQAPSTPPEKGATKVKQEIATPVAKEKPQAEKSSEAKAEKVVEVEETIEMEKTEKTIVESTKEVVPEPTPEEIEEANKKKEMLKILQVQSAEVSSLASNALQQVETAHQSSSQRREAALARLKHVLEVGDMSLIAEALAEAKAAAVPSGAAEMMLAEGLGVETSTQIEDLLDMAEEFRVEPQQARAAELERCQGKSRKELEQRLVELTRMLASARLHSKARLEQALQTKMTQHELQALKALYTSLKEAEKDFDQAAEVEFQELKQELRKQQEEAIAAAVAQAEQEAQEQWELEREQLMQQAEEAKLEAQADRVEEVVAMRKGFDDLEAVLKKDEAIMKRAHSYSRLSAAVLNLEEALLRGNATKELEAVQQAAAEAGDSFVSGLLKSLPVDLLAQPVPTESGLRHVLSEHLSRWATAALVPPDSGLLGELLGRAFRQFYILDGEDVCMPQESETARNLRVLGKAAKHTNVREALPLLDELQGLAAKRVEATTQEARQVLHVRQTLQAVKAHVQCLNAMLM